jgi:hypothetical protein
MDNPEKLATLGIQDTEQKTSKKQKQKQNKLNVFDKSIISIHDCVWVHVLMCFCVCLYIVMSNILSHHMSLRSAFCVKTDILSIFTSSCL